MDPQIVSGILFLLTFVGILTERIDRTIVGLAGAGAMVVAGTALGFYSQEEALSSVDFDTLGLLLGTRLPLPALVGLGALWGVVRTFLLG